MVIAGQDNKKHVRPVFFQKRTSKGGAQTCLLRLLSHPSILARRPLLIVGESSGWLIQEARELGIEVFYQNFPSSRAVWSRLYLNSKFARNVRNKLKKGSYYFFANDHQESLLTLYAAKLLTCPSGVILRSPSMGKSDYEKYKCADHDFIASVSIRYAEKFQKWESEKSIQTLCDGLLSNEFYELTDLKEELPKKILVIGSHLKWKGWRDLVDALNLLQNNIHHELSFDFTGDLPSVIDNDLELNRLNKIKVNFLGRVEKFIELAQGYQLIVNPSRQETFGMALLEVVAAGVPVITSDAGVAADVVDRQFVYEAGDFKALADMLENVFFKWPNIAWNGSRQQANIRKKFMIDDSAQLLINILDRHQISS